MLWKHPNFKHCENQLYNLKIHYFEMERIWHNYDYHPPNISARVRRAIDRKPSWCYQHHVSLWGWRSQDDCLLVSQFWNLNEMNIYTEAETIIQPVVNTVIGFTEVTTGLSGKVLLWRTETGWLLMFTDIIVVLYLHNVVELPFFYHYIFHFTEHIST